MVARRNLKPDIQDSLKRLVDNSKKTHTVAHGVKTAGPGEAVQLQAADGTVYDLEGDTLPVVLANSIQADTIGARLMTAEVLQTPDDGTGYVRMSRRGFEGFDGPGAQTIRLDGKDNFVTGTFQTAASGQRVQLKSAGTIAAADFFASNAADDHLGIWYNATENALNSVAYIQAMPTLQNSSSNPGLNLYPMRQTFKLQGRWQADSDTFKTMELINSTGMAAGDWAQVFVNYQTPFPESNAMYYPVLSAQTAEGVPLVATLQHMTRYGVNVQLNNLSTAKATGRIVVRIVAFCTNS